MSERIPNHMFARFLMSSRRFEEVWRKENQQNFEYCDGEQWSDNEKSSIESRGQQPTVINTILPTVEMVCSVAHDRRADFQVIGREGSDDEKATMMTALLRHVFDMANFEYYHQSGFRTAVIGGRSWFECSVFTDERGKDLIKVSLIPWENVYLDPFSRLPDASDARFIIKTKWVDRDIAKTLFPQAEEMIDSTFTDDYHGQEWEAQMYSQDRGDSFYYDTKSHRVRICECWYTMPEKKKVKILNENTGKEEEKTINTNAVHYVIFSDDIILQGSATDHSKNVCPLGIDMFPLVPLYCMRDRNGRPRGLVRSLIDIQDQINKLNSKFLWTLMTNRLIVEESALKDPDDTKLEMQKPDGLVIVNDGGLSRLRVDDKYRDLSYMSNHLQFLLSTEQRISGVNDSMLGMGGTNERSGIMQSTRISQGAAMQTCIIENMHFSKKRIALVVLRLIGKFYTDYRVVRITKPNGATETFEFNKPMQVMPSGGNVQYDRGMAKSERTIFNKIEDTLYYDVTLKEVPPFNSMRERQLSIFAEVLKSNVIPPHIAAKMLLTLAEMPGKEDIIYELESFYQQQQAAQAAMPPVAEG